MTNTIDDLLNRFFDAVQAGDFKTVSDLYHPDIQVWHSHTKVALPKQPAMAVLQGLLQVATPSYDINERLIIGNRVAQRHRLNVRLRANDEICTLDAAIFFTIENNQITAIDEYLDTTEQQRLRQRITDSLKATSESQT